ncbi:MAG: ABC transporter substrate-binding protein [Spirochaetaceae bacterium]
MKRLVLTLLVGLIALSGAFAAGQGEEDDVLRVAATFGDLGNPFFYTMGQGVEDAALEIDPNAEVTVVSSGYDLNTQTDQMDNFVANDVDIIILNAADSAGIAPAVRRAKEAGVIVVAADVNADGGVDATVTSNNFQAGVQSGQYIVDRLDGEGDVIIINGPPVSAVIDRVDGAMSVFEEHDDINILSDNQNAGGNREGGLRVMTDLLTAFDEIDAVFAINDPTGIGADLAIQQAQREDEMFVVGVDGAPDAVVALNDETSTFAASASQDPYTMAVRAVQIGHSILEGNDPPDDIVLIPTQLITRDNVDAYEGWTLPE